MSACSGSLSVSVPQDDATTHTNRYSITFQHRENLGNGFAAYANYNRVFDASVPSDCSSDADAAGADVAVLGLSVTQFTRLGEEPARRTPTTAPNPGTHKARQSSRRAR